MVEKFVCQLAELLPCSHCVTLPHHCSPLVHVVFSEISIRWTDMRLGHLSATSWEKKKKKNAFFIQKYNVLKKIQDKESVGNEVRCCNT